MNCIIGYTGFVGSAICRNTNFDVYINSKNLESIVGKKFDMLVLACLPAEKWRANLDPELDSNNLSRIQDVVMTVSARCTILISTVDVYLDVFGADETTDLFTKQAYGANRKLFEDFAKKFFNRLYIVRLPGLFGDGLKKNCIYDLINLNQLDNVNLGSQFQWYPISLLVQHLTVLLNNNPGVYNLVTQPIQTNELVKRVFPELLSKLSHRENPVKYDIRSKNSFIFQGSACHNYIMCKDEVLEHLRKFVYEKKTLS